MSLRRHRPAIFASAVAIVLPTGAASIVAACGGGSEDTHGAVVTANEAGGGSPIGAGDDGGSATDATLGGGGDDDGDSDGSVVQSDGAVMRGSDGGCVSGMDSDCPGDFGVHLISGGATFKVWAPHATSASVVTSVSPTPTVMSANGDGTYSATVPGVVLGTTFSYALSLASGNVTRIDPYCRQVTGDLHNCVVTDPSMFKWTSVDGGNGAFIPPPRTNSIVYEMHVGSFSSAGTFAGATAGIAGLAELGINVIELMPVNPSAGGVGTWGYGPYLWMAPNVNYGTEDDLRTFVDTAHKAGIAVWLDVVMNHSDGNAADPLNCYDSPCDKNAGTSGLYFFPAGPYAETPYGPRPDYTQTNVVNMLLASVSRSLDDDGISGFRWDSVSNIRAVNGSGTVPGGRNLLVAANAKTHAAGGLSVAEDLKGDNDITSFVAATGFEFDSQWDGFGYNIDPLLANSSDANRNVATVESELTGSNAGDPFARLLFLEDHDTVGNGGSRLPNQIDSANPTSLAARKRSILGGVLLLTTPGVPMIFMGEEALATGTFTDPALPLPAPTTQGLQVRTFFHDMIALRKSLPGLSSTAVAIVQSNVAAHVVAYTRGTTLVVVNLANQAYTEYDVGVPSAGPWNVVLNTDSQTYGSDFGGGTNGPITARSAAKDGMPFTLPLVLGAYSAVVVTPP